VASRSLVPIDASSNEGGTVEEEDEEEEEDMQGGPIASRLESRASMRMLQWSGGLPVLRLMTLALIAAIGLLVGVLILQSHPVDSRSSSLSDQRTAADQWLVHWPTDNFGFCKATDKPINCHQQAWKHDPQTPAISLFGNSYSGWHWQTAYNLKEVFENLHIAKGTEGRLGFHAQHPHISMHTKFQSGLYHQRFTFRRTIMSEDPDFVVLQDGSLIAPGWRGGHRMDGHRFSYSEGFIQTAHVMEKTFGPALYHWAAKHRMKHGMQKAVVLLVNTWARPEEAFVRAREDKKGALHGHVRGIWSKQNYGVSPGGVHTHLGVNSFLKVHHERDMLKATLHGLGIYRRRLFKGAARHAGTVDSKSFRERCPFEVVIAPVGAAFYDIRRRVEPRHQAPHSNSSEKWWHILERGPVSQDLSSYVSGFRRGSAKHSLPRVQGRHWRIKHLFGASERNFLFADKAWDLPWYGHPSTSGTYLYAAVLKRVVLAAMQGRDGKSMGPAKLHIGRTSKRNKMLLEEANGFDVERFNNDWVARSDWICEGHPRLCKR